MVQTAALLVLEPIFEADFTENAYGYRPEEKDDQGRSQRTGGKDHHQGTPQGGVISPLLANIHMRRFLRAWNEWELGPKLQTHVVNYAEDFVILCRGTAARARQYAERILTKMRRRLNPEKTRLCRTGPESFDFLGYTFGTCYAVRNGKPFLGAKRVMSRNLLTLEEATRRHL